MQQGARLRAIGGELHQTDGAAGPGLDPEGDHAGPSVVAGIQAGVSTEGLALFQHTTFANGVTGKDIIKIANAGKNIKNITKQGATEELITETKNILRDIQHGGKVQR